MIELQARYENEVLGERHVNRMIRNETELLNVIPECPMNERSGIE